MEGLDFIGVGILAVGMLGAALGVGSIFSSFINGVARNPSAEKQLSKYVYIGAAMVEAMGLFAFVLALIILFLF